MTKNSAFNQFFRGDYSSSTISLHLTNDSHSREHYLLSQFLTDPSIAIPDISQATLNLEALRQEAGFNYSVALSLRHSIDQKAANLINSLAICDIHLRIKPLKDAPLYLLEGYGFSNCYTLSQAKIISYRLSSILYQLSSNHDISMVGGILFPLCYEFFSGFLTQFPSVETYSKFANYFYLLGDLEQSSYYYTKAKDLFEESDIVLFGLSNVAFACNNPAEGINLLEKVVKAKPSNPEYITTYGMTLETYGKSDEALDLLEKAPEIIDHVVSRSINIANQFRKAGDILLTQKFYYDVIKLIKCYHNIWLNLASYAHSRKEFDTSKMSIQNALMSTPMSSASINLLSDILESNKQSDDAVSILQIAYNNVPTNWATVINLVQKLKKQNQHPKALHICQSFARYESPAYRLRCNTTLATLYLELGLTVPLLGTLDDLQEITLKESANISWEEWIYVYYILCFIVPSVRDNALFNSLIFSTISQKYVESLHSWKEAISKLYDIDFNLTRQKSINTIVKRIGFISPHFSGHVVSELSIDIIKELSSISDEVKIFIIPIDVPCHDSNFLKQITQNSNLSIEELYYPLPKIIDCLIKLELDALIELDGATTTLNCRILYCRPAKINLSWLGFDAPFVSEDNFFLCDHHTHPEGIDELYKEKLIRLPYSHMCVKGFDVAAKDRSEVRNSLGISDQQVVFIYTAAVRKFNFDAACAHAQILNRIPDSILLVKTSLGLLDIPLETWRNEVKKLGLDTDRVIPIPYAPTKEEHRFYFKTADIYLDAYPYNGGSQTLEALWCELPVVTYCGEQSFARMGYSLLSTAGITEGIAYSWEEYIEWAVRLANDRDLRLSIKERLAKGKDPNNLCPLWNPKQFARDMYDILQDLYQKAVTEEG